METKKAILLLVLLIVVSGLKGQVTIGSGEIPEKAALLDIKSKDGGEGLVSSDIGGVLLPRVILNDINELDIFTEIKKTDTDYATQKKRHKGLAVYNIETNATKNIEEGIYIWNGAKWIKLEVKRHVDFFYMPSMRLDTSAEGTYGPIDLYAEYQRQFGGPKAWSTGAPNKIPLVPRRDMYYYVTGFDDDVFDETQISIDVNGNLTYRVKNASVDGSSYINIVFVLK
ncbi:hypothetical protein [Prevotella sp. 10(H)]|uniref:hypothetical protein n=1 Tax=Prevotella sp. 10(H) TaxID=1158294 RepID=UPI000689997B|nr:hypothetical protein [Prevotella sp. 10(H)]